MGTAPEWELPRNSGCSASISSSDSLDFPASNPIQMSYIESAS